MHTASFSWRSGDRPLIKALERKGVVRAARTDFKAQPEYWVTWWDEGQRRDAWLHEDELE